MTRDFWLAVALIFASFAAYETWLNFHLRAVNNAVAQACFKPTSVPPMSSQAVFFIPKEAL